MYGHGPLLCVIAFDALKVGCGTWLQVQRSFRRLNICLRSEILGKGRARAQLSIKGKNRKRCRSIQAMRKCRTIEACYETRRVWYYLYDAENKMIHAVNAGYRYFTDKKGLYGFSRLTWLSEGNKRKGCTMDMIQKVSAAGHAIDWRLESINNTSPRIR